MVSPTTISTELCLSVKKEYSNEDYQHYKELKKEIFDIRFKCLFEVNQLEGIVLIQNDNIEYNDNIPLSLIAYPKKHLII